MAAYASFDPSGPHVNSEIQAASRDDLKKTAALVVKDQAADTHFFDANLEAKVPRFDMTEIRLGRILGRGGFCVVTEIEKVKIEGGNDQKKGGKLFGRFKTLSPLSEESNQTGDSNQKSEIGIPSVASDYKKDVTVTKAKRRLSRNGVAKYSRHKTRKEGGRYALKQVSSDLASFNKVNYLKGLVDLAIEAKFLSSLDHPNIVQLCGVSSKGFSEFIIVERLQETLSMRFSTWMKVDRQCTGITGVFTGSKIKKTKLYEDRINAAYDIACGVDYLHDRNIIFRDLVRFCKWQYIITFAVGTNGTFLLYAET
jgi:serine/threonine protein kinase